MKIKIIIIILVVLAILTILYFVLNNKNDNKLEVGSIVIYFPKEKTYTFDEKYINNNTNEITLSNMDVNLKITKWKVLSISDNKIDLVPSEIPSYEINIYGTKGYNNGVYILNNICEKLYSDSDKNIVARSINIEDIENTIEKAGNKNKLDDIKNNTEYYGIQHSKTGYSKENSYYPTIYEFEKNSVIDSKTNSNGLSLSESYTKLIEEDKKQAENSIQPYKTFYNTIDYNTTSKLLGDYSSILLPEKDSTNYWIASRIIGNGSDSAHFDIRRMLNGLLRAARLYDSADIPGGDKSHIFPVISVNKKKVIEKDNNYIVE